MLVFSNLITEIKRRATRDQSGTTFDEAIRYAINSSLFRVSREAPWRVMRRRSTFDTVASYTTGSGGCIVVSNSNVVTVTSATLLTDTIEIGRYAKMSGSSKYYVVETINSNTIFTLSQLFTGVSASTNTYEILPQGEYNLPIQAGHRMFLWHEDYGYPFKLTYITDQDFFSRGLHIYEKNTPTHYRMWGEDMVRNQIKSASNLSVVSSATGDTSKQITVFGTISGYPDSETITLNSSNATTVVSSTNVFTSVERVTKAATTTGRITVRADSASTTNTTIAVIPAGDTTAGILYKKIYLYPLPTRVFPINVQFYKDPFRLVNDGDVHELGQEFDEAIILLATMKVKAESDQAEADRFALLFMDELKSLKKTNVDKMDFFPHLERPRGAQRRFGGLSYNQVGSEYGPSSYR